MDILAGIAISLSCILYLQIGGIAGAILFAVGLMTVCLFKFELFTGQAGKLVTKEISPLKLFRIWCGNALGVLFSSIFVWAHPHSVEIVEAARAIMEARQATGFLESLVLGIPCGLLMYAAVTAKNEMKLFYIAFCIGAFILGGFYHCIADMFYTAIGAVNWQ